MRFFFACLALLSLTACLPSAPPAFNHDDGYAAVDQAFAGYGPQVLGQAHCIAQRESGHNPYARNGQYRGLMQLGAHYQGAIDAAAAGLGRAPDFFDPYVNAAASAHIWEQSQWRPWSTAGGCA